MKKSAIFVSALLAAILLAAAFPVFAADNPEVYMDFRYTDSNGTIIEIPHIKGGSKAADSINARLDEIKEEYQRYINPEEPTHRWAKVLAYPCVTERYINIAVTCNGYPTYAYDGEMYTFVYDKTTGRELTLAAAMKADGYTNSTFADSFIDYIEKEARQSSAFAFARPKVLSCTPVGFRVRSNGLTDYYLSTEVDYHSDATLRSHYIYRGGNIYQRSDGTNPDLRIKYGELEHMEPPLYAETQLLTPSK